ncbi:hypothetical protein [Daejeonella sp.]|uniref:hypothetical protein n=1 Tax=Daejeonella sp. TaxID=2805397 RepID=UPI003982FC06
MKKLLFLMMIIPLGGVFSQTKTLYSVGMMQPKIGQTLAFESAWKTHLTKFHNGESKRQVYEIISGDNAGCYQLVEGPIGFADMDMESPDEKTHNLDIYTTISPKIAMEKLGNTYRWIDTLSRNYSDLTASKFMQTNYYVKPGMMPDLMKEIRRGVIINDEIKNPAISRAYVLTNAGSKPVLVIRTALKEGFKQLEPGYLPSTTAAFKTAYINKYGQAEWDKMRGSTTAVYNHVNETETMLVKHRPDLSSPIK